MQRIINFRSIFIMFVLSMLCIYFSFKAVFNLFYLFFIILPVLFLIFLVIKKKFILLGVSAILFAFLSCYTFLYTSSFENHAYDNTTYTISGKISAITNTEYFSTYLKLTKVSLIDDNGKTYKLNGNVSVSVSVSNTFYDVGYNATFSGKINPVSVLNENNELNYFYVKNNIKFLVDGRVNTNSIVFTEANKPLNQKLKDYNRELLINNLGETNGNLAYSLLYGDRTEVEDDILSIFKISGVMHIFAVSGLHIGIIVTLIYFLLKKFKCNNKLIFFITALFLLFYCYMCSFTSSVTRASLMALTLLFAKAVHRKNDTLNTLSLAGLIILTLNPMSFFDVGFQMSFCAVFGIIVFASLSQKLKIKNVFLKRVVSLIFVSLSTQIALLPLLAKYYGYYSVWSILANLFTLPIFSVFYPLLFLVNLICLPLNFLGFLYQIPNAMLSSIIYINNFVSYLPLAKFPLFYCGGAVAVIYLAYLFFTSKYIFFAKISKPAVLAIGFVLVFSLFSYNSLPITSYTNKITFSETNLQNNYSAIISTKNNKFYLLNPNLSSSSIKAIENYLTTIHIANLSGIIFTEENSFRAKDAEKFLTSYNTSIFMPLEHPATENLKQMRLKVVEVGFNTEMQLDSNFSIEYLHIGNLFCGTIIKINNFTYYELPYSLEELNNNLEIFENYVLTNLNFTLSCVKVNDSNLNKGYYSDLFNAEKFIFWEDENVVITI